MTDAITSSSSGELADNAKTVAGMLEEFRNEMNAKVNDVRDNVSAEFCANIDRLGAGIHVKLDGLSETYKELHAKYRQEISKLLSIVENIEHEHKRRRVASSSDDDN